MRIVWWFLNFLLFLVALGFALANTGMTELRFFVGDLVWRAPLVIFLLVFFAVGVAIGLLTATPALFRKRREIARLNRELKQASARPATADPAPVTVPAPVATEPMPGSSAAPSV